MQLFNKFRFQRSKITPKKRYKLERRAKNRARRGSAILPVNGRGKRVGITLPPMKPIYYR